MFSKSLIKRNLDKTSSVFQNFSYGKILGVAGFKNMRLFSEANSKHIFVRGLPVDWTSLEVFRYFDGTFEVLQDVNLIKTREGQNTGKALIKLAPNQVQDILNEFDNVNVEGSSLRLQLLDSIETVKSVKNSDDIIKVYVSGIHYGASDEDFQEYVKNITDYDKIEMPLNHLKKSKGFAMIWFSDIEDANTFIKENSRLSFFGKKMKCKLLETKVHSSKKKSVTDDDFEHNNQLKIESEIKANLQSKLLDMKIKKNKYAVKNGNMEENLKYYTTLRSPEHNY